VSVEVVELLLGHVFPSVDLHDQAERKKKKATSDADRKEGRAMAKGEGIRSSFAQRDCININIKGGGQLGGRGVLKGEES
jgi:hypothetical protein